MGNWLSADQRVVITGMGAVTPNGLDMMTTWDNVRNGRSGIREITLFDTSAFNVKIAGEAHGFDPLDHMSRKEARRADRFTQFAIVAAAEAVKNAGLRVTESNAENVGVYLGCGAGGIDTYQNQQAILSTRGPDHLNPLLIPMIVTDAAAVQVGIRAGARGPNLGISSACSTSLDAIGLALETIRRGDADVMIAGGAEAAINTLGIGGFDRLRALSRRNDEPARASRPFDSARDGFVLSEGGVVLILESLAHAAARGAEPIAELRSYAATSDAGHLTAPSEGGKGGTRCMLRALDKGRLSAADIGYINAHATATPLGDPVEAAGIREMLGDRTMLVPVSSTKSVTGHLLGAAGALAIALTAMALHDRFLPPTINLEDTDEECRLNHVVDLGIPTDAEVGLAPSYGFGGHNSCVVVTRWNG